jgi:putative hemolysin
LKARDGTIGSAGRPTVPTMRPRDRTGAEGAAPVPDLPIRLPHRLRWTMGLLERALGISAVRTALGDAVHLEGRAFVDAVLASLEIEADRAAVSREEIPAAGPLVVVANHHFGAADALLALSLFLPARPDLKVVANRALAVFPQLGGLVLPVAAPSVRRRRIEGTRELVRHLRTGGALLIFPAGQVAGRGRAGTTEDRPWSPGVGRLVHLCGAAVVPVAFEGANGPWFYLARLLHFRLGTLLLVRELLNKAGRRIPVRVGRPIPYAEAARTPDPVALTEHLRRATYDLLPGSRP